MELVYRYGVASWWQAPPEVMEQLWLGHQLDNRLVAVNAEHEQGKAAHWGSFPDVAEHEQALAAATDEVAAARLGSVSRPAGTADEHALPSVRH